MIAAFLLIGAVFMAVLLFGAGASHEENKADPDKARVMARIGAFVGALTILLAFAAGRAA